MSQGGHFEEDWSVRLNDLDLVRATENVSILLSLLMGRGFEVDREARIVGSQSKRAKSIHELSQRLLDGYVGTSYFRGTPATGYHPELSSPNPTEKEPAQERAAEPSASVQNERDTFLEYILSPVDGIEDFRHGLAGSISALAGGPQGAFVDPKGDAFLVIAVNHRLLPDDFETFSLDDCIAPCDGHVGGLVQIADTVSNVVKRLETLSQSRIGKKMGQPIAPTQLTVGSMHAASEGVLRPVITRLCRLRTFTGSPIGAALAAYLPRCGVDAFTAIVNQRQAALIAVAALASGNWFFALQMNEWQFPSKDKDKNDKDKEKKKKKKKPKLKDAIGMEAITFLDTERFIKKDTDVFLDLTGITDGLVLPGVRFDKPDLASTHSLCLRSRTRTIRHLQNHHDLKTKMFRFAHKGNDRSRMHSFAEAAMMIDKLISPTKTSTAAPKKPKKAPPKSLFGENIDEKE